LRRKRPKARAALLLVGHGSRVGAANRLLRRLARHLRTRFPGRIIEVCYLEAARPGVPAGIETCVTRGASRILLVPYFLYLGGHVRRDLPAAAARGRARHRGLQVRIAAPLGDDPRLVAVVSRRVRRGLRDSRWI
jgi:sirohydrochlorin ferrochelatase